MRSRFESMLMMMTRLNCDSFCKVWLHHLVCCRAVFNLLVCQHEGADYHGDGHTYGRECPSPSAGPFYPDPLPMDSSVFISFQACVACGGCPESSLYE